MGIPGLPAPLPPGTPPAVTPGFFLTIGGVDRAAYYMPGSFNVDETLGSRSTASFNMSDPEGTLSIPIGTEVSLVIDDVTIFSGSIESTIKKFPSMDYTSTAMLMQVSCVDHTQILDRHLISKAFITEGQTYGDIVRSIIRDTLSADGIVKGQIQNGTSVEVVTFNHEKASDVLSTLAENVGYVWYVDYNKQLHFRDRINVMAPFNLGPGNTPYRDLVVKETRSQYRNRQLVRGAREISPNYRTETFAGDGATRDFTVTQDVGATPFIEVMREAGPEAGRWIRQSVGVDKEEEGSRQWYWRPGDDKIKQDKDEQVLRTVTYNRTDEEIEAARRMGMHTLPVTIVHDYMRISYRPLVRILARSEDSAEITSRASVEGGSGIYEQIVDDERVESADFAQQRAEGMLSRWGRIPKVATIVTDEPGIRAGQLQTINLSKEGLPDASYLIESVKGTDRGDYVMTYSYTALDGEAIGGWQDFFRKLIERGRSFIVTDGEVIMEFRDSTETLTLTNNVPTPDTSNTLGSYTADAYSVCLVDGDSAVGRTTLSDQSYSSMILESAPSLYYECNELPQLNDETMSQGFDVSDSSVTGNGGTAYFLLGGLSPGAVGEDPTEVYRQLERSGAAHQFLMFGNEGLRWLPGRRAIWEPLNPAALHDAGLFAPRSEFPSLCFSFQRNGPAFPARIMAPYTVLNGETNITIQFWVKVKTGLTSEMNFLNAGNTATTLEDFRFVLNSNSSPDEPNSDSISLHYYDNGDSAVRTVTWSGLTVRTANMLEGQLQHVGHFVHITLVRNYDDQLFQLYMNGGGVGIKTSNTTGDRISFGTMDVDANGFVIGQKFDSALGAYDTTKGLDGLLDEFAIFPQVLSASAISDNAVSRLKRYYTGSRIPAVDDDGVATEPTFTSL